MKSKTENIESNLISSVPSSSYFIETCSKSKTRNLGGWLRTVDSCTLSYITELFKIGNNNVPDGMALPVCDIVSLCLLIREWECGKTFSAKEAWDSSLPMIPRLRRALILESLRRNGVIDILKISILDDDFDIKLLRFDDDLDSLLAEWLEGELDSKGLLNPKQIEFEETYFDIENSEGYEDLF